MIRATHILSPEDMKLQEAARTITLPREDRYKRRSKLTADDGADFLLDLAEAAYMPDGSGLQLSDGGIVAIRAADEMLLEITAADQCTLIRITWHIGNRHTPAEIAENAVYIQPDHVLAEMIRGLGGQVEKVSRPFEPEGGAYGGHFSANSAHHHHA